jgi:hypothetical protein
LTKKRDPQGSLFLFPNEKMNKNKTREEMSVNERFILFPNKSELGLIIES